MHCTERGVGSGEGQSNINADEWRRTHLIDERGDRTALNEFEDEDEKVLLLHQFNEAHNVCVSVITSARSQAQPEGG